MTIFAEKTFADCSLVLCQGQNREIRKTKFFLEVSHYMLHVLFREGKRGREGCEGEGGGTMGEMTGKGREEVGQDERG